MQSINVRLEQVLISSRRNEDIKFRLEQKVNIGIDATDNQGDITKFVLEKIEQVQGSRRIPIGEKLKDKIVSTLLEKSQGMFQWAALHIDQILRLKLQKDIQDRRGRLPKDLKTAYDELIHQIKNSEGSKPEIAHRTFLWMLHSFKPLSTEALIEFVRRNPENGCIEHEDLDINIVLDACDNLLVVEWELVHFGIPEFCRFMHLTSAHTKLATVTLTCLTDIDKVEVKDIFEEELSTQYAAYYWPRHVKKSFNFANNEYLKSMITKAFSKECFGALLKWLRIYCSKDTPQSKKTGISQRLHYTSRLEFDFVVDRLLEEGPLSVQDVKDAIFTAAIHCNLMVLQKLISASPPLIVHEVCDILEETKGPLSELMPILRILGVLSPQLETETGSIRDEDSELLFLVSAAANWEIGQKLTKILLVSYGPGQYEPLKTAVESSYTGCQMIEYFDSAMENV
ncbi:hypothetical protein N7495_004656 [Penicillium taxi]|uniref:uncharacterized protein n=1 Tax=Penicillium taxi TaxID=168475 RepID=UPI0025452ABD|nr:uncharacterized protein N7495_004656 [Penicillium taxi]KAJ5899912.1 hypothetical protein N7495_004656 [Penicillium taxi]